MGVGASVDKGVAFERVLEHRHRLQRLQWEERREAAPLALCPEMLAVVTPTLPQCRTDMQGSSRRALRCKKTISATLATASPHGHRWPRERLSDQAGEPSGC